MTDSYEKIFGNKQRILFVMAHPDDAEIYAGATIARLIADKKDVRIVKMTYGNKGSRQENISEAALIEQRTVENTNAMKALGIKPENDIFLDISDGEVDNSLNTIGKIVRQIRLFKPDILITHNPEDAIINFDKDVNWVNHRDHRNTGKSALDAAYPYSRDILFFPEQLAEPGVESHTVTEFLFVDYYNHSETIAIDVTGFTETRTNAIAAHSSQYTKEGAQDSTDFFTSIELPLRYERFRYVIAD